MNSSTKSCIAMVWHTILSTFQIMYAHARFMFFKKPIITVFGGHRLMPQHKQLGLDIEEIAYQLVSCDHLIMTGGGGGVMQAAHEGACRATKDTGQLACICVSVRGLEESRGAVHCSDKLYIDSYTFFARKWILMKFSKVFFFFPGGFGTLDEFMEVMTLIKVNKMDKRKIVLYKKAYWQGLLEWAEKELIKAGFSDKREMDFFVLVDSVEEAVQELKNCCACD